MEAVHPASERKVYPIDLNLFDQCLVLVSGYFFFGI